MKKVRLIEMPDIGEGRRFTVAKLTNSVRYRIGEELIKNDVSRLCGDKTWDVTIVR